MAMWTVMKHYTYPTEVEGKERRRYEPRFYFDGEGAEAKAVALSQSLNRAMTTWYALETLAQERQGPDHAAQLARAKAVVLRKDPDAVADARYLVEESHPYTGPTEDMTPVVTAMMAAFQEMPDPPADYFEGIFRLIGA